MIKSKMRNVNELHFNKWNCRRTMAFQLAPTDRKSSSVHVINNENTSPKSAETDDHVL